MKTPLLMLAIFLFGFVASTAAQISTTQPSKFKSSEVNDAIAAAEAAEIKAKLEYDKAVVAAKRKLIDALTAGKDKATKAGDLDEAIKLRDKIVSLKSEIEEITNSAAARPASPVGEWEILNVNQNAKWVLTLASDGTARRGKDAPGKWAIEKGELVVYLRRDLTIYFNQIAGDEMKGYNSNKETLAATRKKPQ